MKKIGIAFCGSFCTTNAVIEQCIHLKKLGYEITPIFSEHVNFIDTRFGNSDDIKSKIIDICEHEPITNIVMAERIGPENLFDVLVLAPCTGNTLAKLACGITDNTVTMATKSHLRNLSPVVIALSTNDGLSASAQNIATILNRKNYFFVPFTQDDPIKKPNSLVCDLKLLDKTIENALSSKQIQPIIFS